MRRWYWPRSIVRLGRWEFHYAPTFMGIGVGFYPEIPGRRRASLSIGLWPFLLTFQANPVWYER